MSKKKTHSEYIAELRIKNPAVEVIEQYINTSTPIMHHCIKHDVCWKARPSDILKGKGCKLCASEKISKSNSMIHDEYVQDLAIKNPLIEVVEQYVNAKTKIMHHCLKHDVYWAITPDGVLHGRGCRQCGKEKYYKSRSKTHDQYVHEVEVVNPNIIVVGQYINNKTPIEHYCQIHNVTWSAAPDGILSGYGCSECRKEKISYKTSKTHEQYVVELAIANSDIEVIDKYLGANIPILHRCKIDGYEWLAQPANLLSGCGCPQCNESSGERKVRQWLQSHEVAYIFQKTFADCKDQKQLPFDFYIPAYNTCVEYDGEQHFRSVDLWGGDEYFERLQLHDSIKTRYCKDNNIHLLRISYKQNVNKELEKFFIHLI